MAERWIKLYEKLDKSSIYRDSEMVHLWVHLLIKATKFPYNVNWGGEEITLKPGELITGRKKLSSDLRINESKIQRSLKFFEKCHMIEQRTNRQSRIVTVLNWDQYQTTEQQPNNDRTTSEQRVNTNKKERKKESRIESGQSPLYDPDKFIKNMPTWITEKWSGDQVKDKTESLIDYCNSKGKVYKDYYSALRNYLKKDYPDGKTTHSSYFENL